MQPSISNQLNEIATKLNEGWCGAAELWGGAGVCIFDQPVDTSDPGFYPDPLAIVSPWAHELSWLFVVLRDIAIEVEGYGFWKDTFFQRLAMAAKGFPENEPLKYLLLHITRHGYEMLEMIEIGMDAPDSAMVVVHPRTLGQDIESFDREPLTEFFALRGVRVG
jgi:hypothetical protein